VAQAAALTAQYQAALGALCQRYETRHAEGSAAIAQARHRCRTRGSRRVAVHRLCVACGSGREMLWVHARCAIPRAPPSSERKLGTANKCKLAQPPHLPRFQQQV